MSAAPLAAAAALVGVGAFFAYRTGTINHFYLYGAGTDAFWFAGLIWHMDLRMTNPVGMGDASFFGTHVSPFLYLPGLASRIFGSDLVSFFAATMGVLHGLASATFAACIGYAVLHVTRGTWLAAAVCAIAGAAFIALPLQAHFMQLPHYEIALPSLLIGFLTALARGRYRLATIAFLALLSVREDAGLHAAMFLLAWSAASWLTNRTVERRLLTFALAGIAWAVVAFPLGALLAGGYSQGVLFNLYLGRPLFSHMTIAQIAARLEYFLFQCAHLWGPMAAIALAALLRRDLILLAGAVAVLPWVTLNVGFGAHPAPAKLAFYYGFPLIVAMAWPSIRLLIGSIDARATMRSTAILQVVVIALGFSPALGSHLPHNVSRWVYVDLVSDAGAAAAPAYRAFVQTMTERAGTLGNYIATQEVVGLAPKLIPRRRWLEDVNTNDPNRLASIDTVLFFEIPLRCRKVADIGSRLKNMPHVFEVSGTRVVIVTRLPVSTFDSWGAQIIQLDPAVPLCSRPGPS